MKKITVSVIIPIYNVEQYLKECLDTVINQTLKDIEIICINDGSTDKSLDILNIYAQKDNRIKIITQKNNGVSSARNKGINIAQGKYLSFIDPDDWIDKEMLKIMYNKAIKKDADIVECDLAEHIESRNKIRYRKLKLKTNFIKKIKILNGEPYNLFDIKNNLFKIRAFSVIKLYKKDFILSNKISYPDFGGEDSFFIWECFLAAKRIVYIHKFFYHYRKRANSLSSGNGHFVINKRNYTLKECVNYVKNMLEKYNAYNCLKDDFDEWVITLLYYSWQQNNINVRLESQKFLNDKQQAKLESLIQNNGNKFLECIFSVKSEIMQGFLYKKISFLGYRFYLKIK